MSRFRTWSGAKTFGMSQVSLGRFAERGLRNQKLRWVPFWLSSKLIERGSSAIRTTRRFLAAAGLARQSTRDENRLVRASWLTNEEIGARDINHDASAIGGADADESRTQVRPGGTWRRS